MLKLDGNKPQKWVLLDKKDWWQISRQKKIVFTEDGVTDETKQTILTRELFHDLKQRQNPYVAGLEKTFIILRKVTKIRVFGDYC